MKTKFKLFIALIISVLFLNTFLISNKISKQFDISLLSVIPNAMAQSESPWGGQNWDCECYPCETEYGQLGVQFSIHWSYGSSCYSQSCRYGYC